MPRTRRLDGVGEAHHVMVRGIERRRIFLDAIDYTDFATRMDRLLPEEGCGCFAWALMPNHVHLLIQNRSGSLSRLMARLNTGYARRFNLRHERVGHLFQNRFQSRLVADEVDLMNLVRYVHRNPLKAGLVPDTLLLERYPWCGHGALMGRRPRRPFESVGECLSLFAQDQPTSRQRLARWMEREPAATPPPTPPCALALAAPAPAPSIRALQVSIPIAADSEVALSRLAEALVKELAQPGGKRATEARLRSLIACVAVDELNLTRLQIARHLAITPSAVSHAARKGRIRLRGEGLNVTIRRS